MKFGIGLFFENLSKKFTRIKGTLHEDQYTFFKHIASYLAQFFLELEMFQAKFAEKIKTHIYSTTFSENLTVYEIM
jgi:hypothetical protein